MQRYAIIRQFDSEGNIYNIWQFHADDVKEITRCIISFVLDEQIAFAVAESCAEAESWVACPLPGGEFEIVELEE